MELNLNDEEVIRQYFDTSPNDCFETLYNRYVNKVYNRCFSLTKDSEKAQDFTHDIFIRMFSRLDRFEERSTFSTWLYSISYNYCIDQIRGANRMAVTGLLDNMDYYSNADDAEGVEENLQVLSVAMSTIAPDDATILRMKYQEGLDVRQIALQLNIKDSAVKMRLKRSRDKVRQLCGETSLYLN